MANVGFGISDQERIYSSNDSLTGTVTSAQSSFLSGLTSNVQTQLNNQTTAATTLTNSLTQSGLSTVLAKSVFFGFGSGAVYSSTDGLTWTRTMPLSTAFQITPAYGNNTFVLSKDFTSASTTSYSSTDGITWTERTMPLSRAWGGVAYGNGIFLMTASDSTSAATSTDGITWTTRTLPISTSTYHGLAYGAGKFVVMIGGGSSCYSTDAVTWTTTTPPSFSVVEDLIYGADKFVAIGRNTSTALYSVDGINWNTSTLTDAYFWDQLAYGDGKYLAVHQSSSTNLQKTTANISTDGITWTVCTIPTAASGHMGVGYAAGKFVISNWAQSGSIYSTNGVTWTSGNTIDSGLSLIRLFGIPSYFESYSGYSGIEKDTISSSTYVVNSLDRTLVFTSPCTVTLPNPSLFLGKELKFKATTSSLVQSSIKNVKPLYSAVVNPESADTVILDGSAAGKYATLVSNGNAWIIMEAN